MTVPQLPIADFGIFAPLAVQIMRQLVDGELMITNNIFDQIADRDARAVGVRTRPQRVLGSFSSGLNADRPVLGSTGARELPC